MESNLGDQPFLPGILREKFPEAQSNNTMVWASWELLAQQVWARWPRVLKRCAAMLAAGALAAGGFTGIFLIADRSLSMDLGTFREYSQFSGI